MSHWTEIAKANHAAAMRELAARVNRSAISVPIGDSDATAPGFLSYGCFYSCVPDPLYPWDPAVLKALREISPDFMPISIRSVWRWSNYQERGYIDEPIVLMHHGVARSIRNPTFPVHKFYCEMPGSPTRGLLIPGRASLLDCVPNYIETYWDDDDVNPYGFDLPGAYLPFSWLLYRRTWEAEQERIKMLRAALALKDEQDRLIAKGAAVDMLSRAKADIAATDARKRDNADYVRRDLESFYSIDPGDPAWKQANRVH